MSRLGVCGCSRVKVARRLEAGAFCALSASLPSCIDPLPSTHWEEKKWGENLLRKSWWLGEVEGREGSREKGTLFFYNHVTPQIPFPFLCIYTYWHSKPWCLHTTYQNNNLHLSKMQIVTQVHKSQPYIHYVLRWNRIWTLFTLRA